MTFKQKKFNWDEFFKYAKTYKKPNLAEVGYRVAISRVYYAAYHASDGYLKNKKLKRIKNNSSRGTLGLHQEVWETLKQNKEEQIQKVGQKGDRLRKLRTNADYYNDSEINYNVFKTAYTTAKDILNQ